MIKRFFVLFAVLAVFITLYNVAKAEAPLGVQPAPNTYCSFEVFEGLATHVGYAYYPWEATIDLRQQWRQIPSEWGVEKRGHLAAFHPSMYSERFFGKRVWVLSVETGRMLWFDIVDAMANPKALIDLTPEAFGWLLGYPDGTRGRGGQNVIVLRPTCEGYEWPVYE